LVSVGVALIFSGHYVAAKSVLATVSAEALAAGRGLVGGLILLLLFHWRLFREMTWRKLLILAALAGLGFFANQLLLFAGLKLTTPANAALISALIPVVATTPAMLTGIETATRRKLFGSLTGFTVIALYLGWQHEIDLTAHATGNLFVFANVVCFCLAIALLKRFLKDVAPEAVATGMLLFGGVALTVYGGDWSQLVNYARQGWQETLIMIFEVAVTTAVAYTANLWALKRLSVAETTVFNYLQTPLTVLLAWLFVGTLPTIALIFAFAGVLSACWLVLG
jgi:drug/metabolite transporter (DMT)-like permease